VASEKTRAAGEQGKRRQRQGGGQGKHKIGKRGAMHDGGADAAKRWNSHRETAKPPARFSETSKFPESRAISRQEELIALS
jgi:hypothetical protein